MYIKIENGQPVGHAVVEENFRMLHPDLPYYLTREHLDSVGFAYYMWKDAPAVQWNQKAIETTPVANEQGVYYQTWQVVDLAGDELEQAKQDYKKEQAIKIKGNAEWRLDEFARTRDYFTLLHACSYAASNNLTRRAEGQYCVDARDATWTKVYEIIDEIDSGVRPFDTEYADIESELPPLQWPN